MFGIGFTEILLISIIAILFLGPDKLPGALVEMGKFIKSVKKTIGEAKSSLEEEINIADLKEEALSYKKQLTDATDELKGFKNISLDDFDDDDVTYDEEISTQSPKAIAANAQKEKSADVDDAETAPKEVVATQVEQKSETVTMKKKPKKEKVAQKEKIVKEKKIVKKENNHKKGDA